MLPLRGRQRPGNIARERSDSEQVGLDGSVIPSAPQDSSFLISTLDSVESQSGHWRMERGKVGFKCKRNFLKACGAVACSAAQPVAAEVSRVIRAASGRRGPALGQALPSDSELGEAAPEHPVTEPQHRGLLSPHSSQTLPYNITHIASSFKLAAPLR